MSDALNKCPSAVRLFNLTTNQPTGPPGASHTETGHLASERQTDERAANSIKLYAQHTAAHCVSVCRPMNEFSGLNGSPIQSNSSRPCLCWGAAVGPRRVAYRYKSQHRIMMTVKQFDWAHPVRTHTPARWLEWMGTELPIVLLHGLWSD